MGGGRGKTSMRYIEKVVKEAYEKYGRGGDVKKMEKVIWARIRRKYGKKLKETPVVKMCDSGWGFIYMNNTVYEFVVLGGALLYLYRHYTKKRSITKLDL
jgi:hypothetical protein